MNPRPEAVKLTAIAAPIVLVAVVGAWLVGQGTPTPSASPAALPTPTGTQGASPRATTTAGAPALVAPDSATIAAPGATVIVVEFLDFECEACGAAFPVVKRILAEYEGRITYAVRDFPGHVNSVLAASAAYAAGEQGRYWEMYDKLFEEQASWAERQDSQAAVFVRFAEELGLDMPRFTEALASGRYVERIRRDFEAGRDLGVDGTPTFFINGQKFVGVPAFDDFQRIIDEALG